MKSLSALCHALDIDLSELADLSDLPAGKIESWATSDELPGLQDLRDIAVALGTSVSNLLAMEIREIRPTIETLAGENVDSTVIDPFWGFVGVEAALGAKHFYPISEDTAREIEDEIRDGDSAFSIHTLNHRVLIMSPRQLASVRLIQADEDGEAINEHTTNADTVYDICNAEIASALPLIAELNVDHNDLDAVDSFGPYAHKEWAATPDSEALRIQLDQAMGYSVSDLFKFRVLRQFSDTFGRSTDIDQSSLSSAQVQRTGGHREVLKHIDAASVRKVLEDLDRESYAAYTLAYGRKSKQTVHYSMDDIGAIDIPLCLLHSLMLPEIYQEQIAALKQMKAIDDEAHKWFLGHKAEGMEPATAPVRSRPKLVVSN